MLVLTRKGNQSIMIGDDIEVSVLAIMGEKVRIGIDAPRTVPVFRKEVYLEIQAGSRRSGRRDEEDGDRRRARPAEGVSRRRASRPSIASVSNITIVTTTAVTTIVEREQREAQLALLAPALHAAHARTLSGVLAQALAAHDRLGGLLAEGLLELG